MWRYLSVVALIGACNDARGVCHEPAQLTTASYIGPGHSTLTPITALPAIVAGGTAEVPLYCDTTVGECEGMTCNFAAFDLPYRVDTRSGPVMFDRRELDNRW